MTFQKLATCGAGSYVLEGRTMTAKALLHWFQSKAERTRAAWSAAPLLASVVALLYTIIRKIEKAGPENIDPVEASYVAHEFREISDRIRVLIAHGDLLSLNEHLPFRLFLPRLQRQGESLHDFASQFLRVD